MSNGLSRICSATLLAFTLMLAQALPGHAEGTEAATGASGVIAVKSGYDVDKTVERLTKDVAAKGITFFQKIDQAGLAAKAGIELRPSVLLVFGNPPLGTQFMTANPQAGLDWPVRMLVYRDAAGTVWVAYTDFDWIARRHGITTRGAQFHMASQVAASIAESVRVKP